MESDDQTILRASPVYIRVAAIVSCIVSLIGIALATYVYVFLAHPRAVHHFGRLGETTESIESYLFGYPFIQTLIAAALTYKWLRWSADVQRAASNERKEKARNPQMRQLNLDILYRIFCLGALAIEAILLGFVVYRTVMLSANNPL